MFFLMASFDLVLYLFFPMKWWIDVEVLLHLHSKIGQKYYKQNYYFIEDAMYFLLY